MDYRPAKLRPQRASIWDLRDAEEAGYQAQLMLRIVAEIMAEQRRTGDAAGDRAQVWPLCFIPRESFFARLRCAQLGLPAEHVWVGYQ